MANKIDQIAAEERWKIASNSLTAAVTAYGEVLKGAIGDDKFFEFLKSLYSQAGASAKQFAESLSISVENAEGIAEALLTFALATMGPDFEFEDVEVSEDKCVGRTTKCPWYDRYKEQGVSEMTCNVGHQAWGEGVIGNLNSNYSFTLTKSIPTGDEYCEYVIERK